MHAYCKVFGVNSGRQVNFAAAKTGLVRQAVQFKQLLLFLHRLMK